MSDVRLSGCTPEPLQAYGKALGVFRLVVEQADPAARARWERDVLVIRSRLDHGALLDFFTQLYTPTPLLAPWNKDGGFLGGRKNLRELEQLSDPRFGPYRTAIATARSVLDEVGLTSGGRPIAKDQLQKRLKLEKGRLIALLRARWPEEATRWLDAVVTLASDEPAYPPLFGAGGTDGRFEASDAFMGALLAIARDASWRRDALEAALFGSPEPALDELTPGLFAPGGIGGPNYGEGFEGGGGANPWDIVLGFEGLLLLSASVAKKFGAQTAARAVFPFVVRSVAAGHPTVGAEASKGEVWLPIWDRPASLAELRHLFREGRAEWNGRPAVTGVDVARALVSLGVDRGLTEFRRYGLQNRSGRSYLAAPFGRFRVRWRPESLLLADLDPFLDGLAPIRQNKQVPAAVHRCLRDLDEAILAYCGEGSRARLLDVLLATAALDRTLATRPGLRERVGVRPAPVLSRGWVFATDDKSPEFDLAAAIASLQPGKDGIPGWARQYLAPVRRAGRSWVWDPQAGRRVVWTGRDTIADLGRLLERRLLEAEAGGDGALVRGGWRARLESVAALIRGDVDAVRLGRLLEALALLDWGTPVDTASAKIDLAQRPAVLPTAVVVLKLTFLSEPERFTAAGARDVPRADPRTLGLLRAGDVWGAARLAARRLHAVGLTPVGWDRLVAGGSALRRDPALGGRIIAALVTPVSGVEALFDLALGRESPPAELEPATMPAAM